ncbi:creatinine amidohydrolase [Oxalobacteraceae bacterium GrIS 1.11]
MSRVRSAVWMLAAALSWPALPAHAVDGVYIEDMTTTELRERINAGATTILIPIGGTEQSGPYITLGKHNTRVHILARQIAQKLGNTVVAPVVAYVPEGAIHPPVGHMRLAGTISIPDATFEALLEASARSFKQHGMHDVIFIGDHGGYQKNMEKVAARLNREWAADPSCRVHALLDYYEVTQTAFVADLKKRGFGDAEIGVHAGLADTALALAVDKSLVRADALAHAPKPDERDGVRGDPRRATAELGELGVRRIVDTSVAAIQTLIRPREPRAATTSNRK